MKQTQRNWKSLPPEILLKIFKEAPSHQSSNFALVCKAWTRPADAVLYINVNLKTFKQLREFYAAIKNKPYLGETVKKLDLLAFDTINREIEPLSDYLQDILFTRLPQLEELNMKNLYLCTLTFDIFLHSHLKKLKRLQRPDRPPSTGEVTTYVDCALVMKDRLENIYIPYSDDRKLNAQYQPLYDNLHQFKKLIDIFVSRGTDDGISVFEYVVEACKSIKKLDIDLMRPLDWQLQPNSKLVSNLTPRKNIKFLKGELPNDYNLLSYIIHKFPQLRDISLKFDCTRPSHFDILLFTQLLHFISGMEEYLIDGIPVDSNNLLETIGTFWEDSSTPGTESVSIVYYNDDNADDMMNYLNISKKVGESSKTTITFIDDNFEWQPVMDFIEKSGKFIADIRIHFRTFEFESYLDIQELPNNFISHLLTHCPHLESIYFIRCVLKQECYSQTDLFQKRPIESLFLDYCAIEPGVMERLSASLSEIGELNLRNNVRYQGPEDNIKELQIIMPQTKIDTIFFASAIRDREELNFKINLVRFGRKNERYFRVCVGQMLRCKKSNKQEYEEENDEQRIYICCQTYSRIQFWKAIVDDSML